MTWPSDMLPSRYFETDSRTGSTGARNRLTCETMVVRILWTLISFQRSSTFPSERSSPARSSASPPRRAMLSPVLAKTRQDVAEIGFRLVLAFRGGDEAASDERHSEAREHRPTHGSEDEEARNLDPSSEDVEVERSPVHNTTVKVTAENSARIRPTANSTGPSVATLRSSAIRYSGFS
jgi:hypothetical protein